MTEQSKIPVPSDKESSLLERASGAFGFNPFAASPIKGKLPEREMKRAKVRRIEREQKGGAEAQRPSAQQAESRPENAQKTVEQVVEPAPQESASSAPISRVPAVPREREDAASGNLPVPVRASELVVQQNIGAVEFSGKKYPVKREHLRNQGLIVPEGSSTALVEEFRIVKRQLLKVAKERGTAKSRRILICSPHPGEGKTFCASNLAIAIAAERDSEVLLVDGDFAKPSILSTFGLPKGPGFMDCLADSSLNPEDMVIGTDIPGLWVLPSGNQTSADSEYLANERTGELLDRLTMGAPHRTIIFDTPPALAASPAAELAKHVGQAVLVARADKTGQSALEDACQLLAACPDIKLLLNATQFSPSGRNFGSYYGYGK